MSVLSRPLPIGGAPSLAHALLAAWLLLVALTAYKLRRTIR
jgi:hypothetical protein